ncbi:dihydrolipoyl dehydrogenase [Lacrimispora sp. NSJ-141]|uniref:Dihydrolipoyl dehydrogenase n=1 Tax=Lientehia hominis TaxID=2897778 RepID=A0AAP2W8E7_9FIRM|nr:dihydrolipoyl dehydrogenase [Lientehia hominis]MCD2493423.1 dihydrolipoyl dehydrogenase [Lientehia hominis]
MYGLIVIGAGPGGYTAALEAAKRGIKTAVIEKRQPGGTCLNRGCIPTKVLLHSAELMEELSSANGYGVEAGDMALRPGRLKERQEEVQETLRQGIIGLFKRNKVDFIQGEGMVLDAGHVQVRNGGKAGENRILETERILIAAGARPARPPIPGAELPGVVTSDELLERPFLKENSLLIIGGGVIGVEFASAFQRLGIQVTIVEALDRVLAGMDKEISQSVRMLLKKKGVEIHTSAAVESLSAGSERRIACRFREKEACLEREADCVLIAAGRRPSLEGLIQEGAGVKTENGRILVDSRCETSVPGIYAIGDITGGIQLAHAASAQAVRAVAAMMGETVSGSANVIPSCVYTSPEIAAVGITVDQAKEQGIEAVSAKYPMSANGKTVIGGGERGFIRVVAEKRTGKVLGAQMMCGRATDMISIFTMAVSLRLTLSQMASVVYPHPTYAEGIREAVRLCMEKYKKEKTDTN